MMPHVRDEFVAALGRVTPAEVLEFRRRLDAGQVDGDAYIKEGCGCFIGTVAMARMGIKSIHEKYGDFDKLRQEIRAGSYSMTQWEEELLRVCVGETPRTNEHARAFADAIDEFIASNEAAFAKVA